VRNNHKAVMSGGSMPRMAGGRPEGAAGMACRFPGRDDVWKNTPYADKPVHFGHIRVLNGVAANFAHINQDGAADPPPRTRRPVATAVPHTGVPQPTTMPAGQVIREIKQQVAAGIRPQPGQAQVPNGAVMEMKQQLHTGLSSMVGPVASSLQSQTGQSYYQPTHRSVSSQGTSRSSWTAASSSIGASASQVSGMSGASQSSMASQLDRLATLYQQNLLTEQEYADAKAQTLAVNKGSTPMSSQRRAKRTSRPGTAMSSFSAARSTHPALRTSRSNAGAGKKATEMQYVPINTKGNATLSSGPLLHNAWIAQPEHSSPAIVPTAPQWGAACRGEMGATSQDHPYRYLQQSSAELLTYNNLHNQSNNPVTYAKTHKVIPNKKHSLPGTPQFGRPPTPLELTVEALSAGMKSTRPRVGQRGKTLVEY